MISLASVNFRSHHLFGRPIVEDFLSVPSPSGDAAATARNPQLAQPKDLGE